MVSLLPLVERECYPEVQHVSPTFEQSEVGIADTPTKIIKDIISQLRQNY